MVTNLINNIYIYRKIVSINKNNALQYFIKSIFIKSKINSFAILLYFNNKYYATFINFPIRKYYLITFVFSFVDFQPTISRILSKKY